MSQAKIQSRGAPSMLGGKGQQLGGKGQRLGGKGQWLGVSCLLPPPVPRLELRADCAWTGLGHVQYGPRPLLGRGLPLCGRGLGAPGEHGL